MIFVKYLIIFLILFLLAYIIYYVLAIKPHIDIINKKKKKKPKKERELPTEIKLLKGYYKIDIEKIGLIRVLRIVNFVNAFFLALLTMLVLPFKQVWLKLIILAVLILPSIWFVYYVLAKYLKHLERKSEENV